MLRPYRVVSAQLGAPQKIPYEDVYPSETESFVVMEGPAIDPAIHMTLGLASGYRMPSQVEVDEGVRALLASERDTSYLEYLDKQRLEAAKARALLTRQRAMAERRYQASKDDQVLKLQRRRLWLKLLADPLFLSRYAAKTKQNASAVRRNEAARDDRVAAEVLDGMLSEPGLFSPGSGRSLRHVSSLAEELQRILDAQEELDKVLNAKQGPQVERTGLSSKVQSATSTVSGRLTAFGEPVVRITDGKAIRPTANDDPERGSEVKGYRLLPSSSAPMLGQYLDIDGPELRRPPHIAAASYRAATGASVPVAWRYYLRDLSSAHSDESGPQEGIHIRRGARFSNDGINLSEWPRIDVLDEEDGASVTSARSGTRSASRSRSRSTSRSRTSRPQARPVLGPIAQARQCQMQVAASRVMSGQKSAHKTFEEFKRAQESMRRRCAEAAKRTRPPHRPSSAIERRRADLNPEVEAPEYQPSTGRMCGSPLDNPESRASTTSQLPQRGARPNSARPIRTSTQTSSSSTERSGGLSARNTSPPDSRAPPSRSEHLEATPRSRPHNPEVTSSPSSTGSASNSSLGGNSNWKRAAESLRKRNLLRSKSDKLSTTSQYRTKILPFVPSSLVRDKLNSKSRGEAGRSSKHLDASDRLYAETLTAESAAEVAASASCSKPPSHRTCAAATGVPEPYGPPPARLPLVTSDSCFKLKFRTGDVEWKSSTVPFPTYLRHRGTIYHDVTEELIPANYGFKNPVGLGERCHDPHVGKKDTDQGAPPQGSPRPSPTTERGRTEAEDEFFWKGQLERVAMERYGKSDLDLGPYDNHYVDEAPEGAKHSIGSIRRIVYGSAAEKQTVEQERLAMLKSKRPVTSSSAPAQGERASQKQSRDAAVTAFVYPI